MSNLPEIHIDVHNTDEWYAMDRQTRERRPGTVGHDTAIRAKLALEDLAKRFNQEATKAVAVEVARMEGRIEQAEKQAQRAQDSLQEAHSTINRLRAQLDEKRTISEQRRADREGMVEVTFSNGHKGWTVAQLEEIAYRVRLGGAADDTPVQIGEYLAQAKVVDPTLVSLDVTSRKREQVTEQPGDGTVRPSWLVRTPMWVLALASSASGLLVSGCLWALGVLG